MKGKGGFMSSGVKALIIIVVIFVVLVGLGVLAYFYFFVGFTSEQKYAKCLNTCREVMLRDEDIPACYQRCAELYGHHANIDAEQGINQSKTPTPTPSVSKSSSPAPSDLQNTALDCEYVWPQKIVKKDSRELVYWCSSAKPWCNPADNTYENIGCCANYSETTKQKTDCTLLPDLLSKISD